MIKNASKNNILKTDTSDNAPDNVSGSASKNTSVRLAFIGALSAVYVILSLVSIGTNDFKVSIETMAVLMAAITLGPAGGALTGIVGELVHQMLIYGIDATTVLWLMPYAAEGLIAGIMAERLNGPICAGSLAPVIIAGEAVLMLVVTPVNAVSAIIQGWGNWATIIGVIPVRILITVVRIIIYIIVIPFILRPLIKSGLLPDHDRFRA